jgi:hypothetical protein
MRGKTRLYLFEQVKRDDRWHVYFDDRARIVKAAGA